ncbi:MAG: DUF5688 family protein [Lachnospiraceae bacterium]|nr:DUF5688 family protein [Lachnospiraceae bacterium]
MNFNEFKTEMKEAVCLGLGDKYTVSMEETDKNNGVILTGLMVKTPDQPMSPVFYLNSYYRKHEQEGVPVEDLAQDILRTFREQENDSSHVDMDFFRDYEKVREGLVLKVVNTAQNQEALKVAPHMEHLNLSLLPYYLFREGFVENGSILIRKEHLKVWGITEEQLFEDAMKYARTNLPCSIMSMEAMMAEMGQPFSWEKEEEDDTPDPMYILSNRRKLFGAAGMFYPGVLESFSEKLGLSFYILPSSIHEVLLVPDCKQYRYPNAFDNAQDLLGMVMQVNATEVDPEEVLADAVYYYNHETREMSVLAEK